MTTNTLISNEKSSRAEQKLISSTVERGGIASFDMPGFARLLDQSKTALVAKKGSDGQAVKLSRRLVLKKFSAMSRGALTIYDIDNEVHRFGKPGQSAAEPSAEIRVVDSRVYRRIALNGILGAAEAFMDGDWTTPDLVSVVRFMVFNLAELERINQQRSLPNRMALRLMNWLNRNSVSRSRENIAAHYDLGNDFFEIFLDPSMMYSSALFERPEMTLEQASYAKLDALCRKLQLQPSDHLVEIGTGWGGMAIYAAKNYGCRVTTTTISQEQFDFALRQVKEQGLEDQVTVLKKDYRDLTGKYDKLVSIEMIEAVGYQYFQQYFSKCSSLLKPNGLMALQAITITDQRYERAKDAVDFIKRYIFPGGCLPSVNVISQHVSSDTDMIVTSLDDITQDYAETLKHWREAFFENLHKVKALGFDERFIRMWEYYLCYCEGGFRERVIGTVQMVLAKPDYRKV